MTAKVRFKCVLGRHKATVRIMFDHPMETGRRRDEFGNLVPAHYISKVVCELRGRVVLNAQWSTGVSHNPALMFELDGARKGEQFKIRWEDNAGRQAEADWVLK